ncbi:hypothetical protein BFW41_12950 [Aeromonas hydrophila]|nr:hypothetical protein BFW41_12950 [Aeromonas hydrophila]
MGADYTQMCRAWQSSWHTFAQNQSQLSSLCTAKQTIKLCKVLFLWLFRTRRAKLAALFKQL